MLSSFTGKIQFSVFSLFVIASKFNECFEHLTFFEISRFDFTHGSTLKHERLLTRVAQTIIVGFILK